MKENNIAIVEEIMQEKIASFIKQNTDMPPKELAYQLEKLINKKEEMYNMDKKQIKEELKKMNNQRMEN